MGTASTKARAAARRAGLGHSEASSPPTGSAKGRGATTTRDDSFIPPKAVDLAGAIILGATTTHTSLTLSLLPIEVNPQVLKLASFMMSKG